jgi:hypothetical protein
MIGAGTAQDFTITKTPFGVVNGTQTPDASAISSTPPIQPLQNLNRNRFYRPDIGKFLSKDPRPDTRSLHQWYQYVQNMPIDLNDPDGATPQGCEKVGSPVPTKIGKGFRVLDDPEHPEPTVSEDLVANRYGFWTLICKWTFYWLQLDWEKWRNMQELKCCAGCNNCWKMWEPYGDPWYTDTGWQHRNRIVRRDYTVGWIGIWYSMHCESDPPPGPGLN